MAKQMITVMIERADINYSTLDSAIETLQRYKVEHSEYGNLRLMMEREDYDENEHLYLYGDRLETDKEEQQRIAFLAQRVAEREARERADYERLKAKFKG